jgi:hypothetical protein
MKSDQLSTKNIHVVGSGNKISEFPTFFIQHAQYLHCRIHRQK